MSVPYHAWTHRPKARGGTDPIEIPVERPWIALENPGQTLASGSFKHSLFTDAWFDPALVTGDVLAAGDDDDTYFSIEVASEDSNDYWQLRTKVEGWYTAEFVHLWGNLTSLTSSPAYAAQQITFSTTNIHFACDFNIGAAADWTSATGGMELGGYAYIHTYRTIYLPQSKAWPAYVRQTTGDNRDVSGHLKVWYDGHYGSSNSDNADWSVHLV